MPSNAEWNNLIDVPGSAVAGTKLKAKSPDWNGTDDYGFTALNGGGRNPDGTYFRASCWWTTIIGVGESKPHVRFLHTDSSRVLETVVDKNSGYYVRCVKD